MESLRWSRIVAVGIAVVAGAACLGQTALAGVAGVPPWDPPPCPAGSGGSPGAAGAWYRLDPVLDAGGTLAGRRLVLGVAGSPARRLDLAAESFASGPVGGLVIAGEDDGARSRLRLLDPGRGCSMAVADEAAVVRSAALAPDGGSILEHRVDRVSRRDLGVWRRSLDGKAVRVLPGLPADDAVGRVFATDLRVTADGRVVVSSCGIGSCVVRVVASDGSVAAVRGTGPALGVAGHAAVVRAACDGWPCPVEAVDLGTGTRRTLAREAWAAELGGVADSSLAVETAGGAVATIDVNTGRRSATLTAGGVPVPRGSMATSGAETPAGSVALAPGGRAWMSGVTALDPASGVATHLEELVR